MLPTLTVGPLALPSYGLAVVLAFVIAGAVRRAEVRRLGYDHHPRHAWVGVGGLLGAMVGAKLGLLLFVPPEAVGEVLAEIVSLDFTGKTILGGIAGGYLGVEITKRVVGIGWSTGDGFAVSLPVGQAIGRVGCLLHGCCYGTPHEGLGAVYVHGAWRHPTQLYEAALDLWLAGALWLLRGRTGAAGGLFRLYLIGYAGVRFVLDPWRADGSVVWGPLTAVQWACAAVILGSSLRALKDRGATSGP